MANADRQAARPWFWFTSTSKAQGGQPRSQETAGSHRSPVRVRDLAFQDVCAMGNLRWALTAEKFVSCVPCSACQRRLSVPRWPHRFSSRACAVHDQNAREVKAPVLCRPVRLVWKAENQVFVTDWATSNPLPDLAQPSQSRAAVSEQSLWTEGALSSRTTVCSSYARTSPRLCPFLEEQAKFMESSLAFSQMCGILDPRERRKPEARAARRDLSRNELITGTV